MDTTDYLAEPINRGGEDPALHDEDPSGPTAGTANVDATDVSAARIVSTAGVLGDDDHAHLGRRIRTHDDDGEPLIEIGVTPRRFAVLFLYVMYGMNNQLQYVGFTNIVRQVQSFFDASAFQVNMLTAIFAAAYIIFVFPTCTLYSKLGLRNGLLIGVGLNAIGAIGKTVVAVALPNFWLLLFFQAFSAGAQLFFLSLPPLLAATWFPVKERSLATAIGTLSSFLGMAAGFIYGPLIVNDDHHGKGDFLIFFAISAVWAVVLFVAVFFVVLSQPSLPPSFTSPLALRTLSQQQGVDADGQAPHVLALLWSQRHNKSFIALVIVFGVAAGMLTAISSVLAQLLEPYHVSETQAGAMLLTGILGGCVSCVVVGPLLDKFRKYHKPLMGLFAGLLLLLLGLVTMLLFVPIQGDRYVYLCFVTVPLIPIVLLPTLPIGMEFSVELTYPLDEVVPASACMWTNSFGAVCGTVACSIIIGNTPTASDAIIVIGAVAFLVALSLGLLVFIVREDLRRLRSERSSDSNAAKLQP